MGVAYKNLSIKSDFPQMRLSRSRFDYERGVFRSIVNEFKLIGLISENLFDRMSCIVDCERTVVV